VARGWGVLQHGQLTSTAGQAQRAPSFATRAITSRRGLQLPQAPELDAKMQKDARAGPKTPLSAGPQGLRAPSLSLHDLSEVGLLAAAGCV